jgi:hypothetical protein
MRYRSRLADAGVDTGLERIAPIALLCGPMRLQPHLMRVHYYRFQLQAPALAS